MSPPLLDGRDAVALEGDEPARVAELVLRRALLLQEEPIVPPAVDLLEIGPDDGSDAPAVVYATAPTMVPELIASAWVAGSICTCLKS